MWACCVYCRSANVCLSKLAIQTSKLDCGMEGWPTWTMFCNPTPQGQSETHQHRWHPRFELAKLHPENCNACQTTCSLRTLPTIGFAPWPNWSCESLKIVPSLRNGPQSARAHCKFNKCRKSSQWLSWRVNLGQDIKLEQKNGHPLQLQPEQMSDAPAPAGGT